MPRDANAPKLEIVTDIPDKAMVIFAHPDDAEIGSGGVVAKWAAAGCEVTYVLCTNGAAGTADRSLTPAALARKRAEEQRAAARSLEVKEIVFLGYPDGELEDIRDARRGVGLGLTLARRVAEERARAAATLRDLREAPGVTPAVVSGAVADAVGRDDLVVDEADLQVPHPEMMKRSFVLVPLVELDPLLVHPVTGETLLNHLSRLDDRPPVRRGVPPQRRRTSGSKRPI